MNGTALVRFSRFSEYLSSAACGERFIIMHPARPLAALIGAGDLERSNVLHRPNDAEYCHHNEADRDQPDEDHPDPTEGEGEEEYPQLFIIPPGPILLHPR